MSEAKPFFVHIHIPKTGGTTFTTVLEKNFNELYDPFEGRWSIFSQKLGAKEIKKYITKFPSVMATSSHMFNLDLPFDMKERKIVALSWVRDPIDMFFSFYFHMRHSPYGETHMASILLLDDYIQKTIDDLKEKNRRYLTGILWFLMRKESQESLTKVKEHISNKNLILLKTYSMNESLSLLQKLYPDYFKDISYSQSNISTKDQLVTPEQKEQVHKIISPYDWELLKLAESAY